MVIVTDEAFAEMLDRVESLSSEPGVDDDVDAEDPASPRHQFVVAVDRAVKNVVTRRDRRVWSTHTLRRFGCRLHFFCNAHYVYLVACAPRDREREDADADADADLDEEDYST